MSNIASTLGPNAKAVGFTATGDVAADNVQDAIAELDNEKSAKTHTTHTGEAASFATNGYKKFADGTILQLGKLSNYTFAATNTNQVTFPIAFSDTCYVALGNCTGSGVSFQPNRDSLTATSFMFGVMNTTGNFMSGSGGAFFGQAIGR